MAIAGPPRPPLLPARSHSRDGMGLQEALQSAVNSQGSCFLSFCHLLFLSGEQWGTAPDPFSLPPAGMMVTDAFLAEGGFFPAFLFAESVRSQRVPLPQVPKAGHCTEHCSSKTCWLPAPGPTAAFFKVVLFICLFPHLHSSVTGFRIVWVCFPSSLQLSHSLLLSKVCNFQQLLLISVSHWRRSFFVL